MGRPETASRAIEFQTETVPLWRLAGVRFVTVSSHHSRKTALPGCAIFERSATYEQWARDPPIALRVLADTLWDETWQCWFPTRWQMAKIGRDIVGALRLGIRCAMREGEQRGKGVDP